MAFSGPIHVYGLPGRIGGGYSELWHSLMLWRSLGIEVVIHPCRFDNVGKPMVEGIGCRIEWSFPRDSIVIGFCDAAMLADAADLRKHRNRTIYAPCMNRLTPREVNGPPLFDRYVFQSQYQYDRLSRALAFRGMKPDHCVKIHGAFSSTEFPFYPLPHNPGEPFIVGKLSRATCARSGISALDKYPKDLWEQYAAIPYRPIKARVMGWSAELESHCGKPPKWAECLPAGAETPQEFLSKIHCLVPGIGCIAENWPRIGLEAMSAGVPVVAEEKGGWPELLHDSVAENIRDQSETIRWYAECEPSRILCIERQRHQLNYNLEGIGDAWMRLFDELSRD